MGQYGCQRYLITQAICIIVYGTLLTLNLNNKLICCSKSKENAISPQFPDIEDESVKTERDRVNNADNDDILMVQNLVKKYVSKDPDP